MSGRLARWMRTGGAGGGVASYGVAVVSVAGAAAVSAALWPVVQPSVTPFFFAAVALSSWHGGLGPGLAATALAVAVAEYYFVPPFGGMSAGTLLRVLPFVLVAWLMASLYERARYAHRQAEDLARAREALLLQEQAARAEAETANRAKDEFLAMLSHELRTPLNALMGWTWWLRRGDLSPERTAQALQTIERNSKSLAQLIEDLLDVSRIRSGKLRLETRPTDLAAVIDAAVEAIRPAASAKSIEIDVARTPDAFVLDGDPDRLQQVMWNLLSNAVKFTPEHGRVGVRLERSDSGARIVVWDTGRGISAPMLPHVFERFRQADHGSRTPQGLGLGLTIVRHLVELHGGTVTAESAGENQGAAFTVDLPLRTPHPGGDTVAAAGNEPASSLAHALEGIRLVLVEDDPDARTWLTGALTACGAHVTSVGSVREAMDALASEEPHALVSDLRLPGEDGYDLIRRVRSLPEGRLGQIPAIALTAYPRVEDRARALAAGYHMHVPKPVALLELVKVVGALLARPVEA